MHQKSYYVFNCVVGAINMQLLHNPAAAGSTKVVDTVRSNPAMITITQTAVSFFHVGVKAEVKARSESRPIVWIAVNRVGFKTGTQWVFVRSSILPSLHAEEKGIVACMIPRTTPWGVAITANDIAVR